MEISLFENKPWGNLWVLGFFREKRMDCSEDMAFSMNNENHKKNDQGQRPGDLVAHLTPVLNWSQRLAWFHGELVLVENSTHQVTRMVTKEAFLPLIYVLKGLSGLQFQILADRTAVDYPQRQPRFDVVYQRLSVRYSLRCMVKVSVEDGELVPSLTGIYASAGWAERECYDMFGVPFEGHPDLRRLLTDYGFEGHPLRKDFPLTGYTEVRYDETVKRVVSEPVERSQDLRMQDPRLSWKVLTNPYRVKTTNR